MTAGVLAELGLEFGKTIKGGKENPKGYFENRAVRDNVLKPQLVANGGDYSAQFRFPRQPQGGTGEVLRSRVLEELRGANAYKDAKLCLIWSLWVKAFPDSLYVIVRRDMDDFAASCLRTPFMTAFHRAEGWKKWGQHFVDCCDELKKRVDYIEVWPDGTPDVFRPVAEFAGLTWNGGKVERFVDPALWNRKHTR